MKNLKLLSVIFFAAFALSAIAATSAFAEEGEGWLIEGHTISEAEGALAAETEEEVELSDTKTAVGTATVLCSYILDGTIGPETKDEITEVLNLAKVKIGSNLEGEHLLCTGVTGCEKAEDVEVWPDNLPWLTELEGMDAEPHILDRIFGSGTGKEPGWEIRNCLVLGLNMEDLCEGTTSAKAASTSEKKYVLDTFGPEAPIESQKIKCTQGGAESGTIKGEGSTLLTNGKQDGVLICRGYNAINAKYKNRSDCLNNRNPGNYMPPPTVYEDYEL